MLHFSTMAKKNRAALAQLDEALHAVGDCDQAVWTLKKSIGECRSRLGGGSFASTAAEARQIARALAMCAKSIDAAVAAAVAESVAAAEKAPGGATPAAWGAGKGRKEFGGAGSNSSAVGMSTPAARTRPASAPLDMDSPAAARLIAAARETVTVHLVRPRKPTTSENNNNNLKPPVAAPPKPVPFQFQRRVRDEVEPAVGIGAFAQLLPAMQEKLGMATHVVEVVGADGCVRRSDAEFVDGKFIFYCHMGNRTDDMLLLQEKFAQFTAPPTRAGERTQLASMGKLTTAHAQLCPPCTTEALSRARRGWCDWRRRPRECHESSSTSFPPLR